MRYIKPLKKVLLTGTKALMFSALQQPISHHKKINNSEQIKPILFMHGFMGFTERKIMNVTLFDYFNGVHNILEHLGYRIYSPSVNSLASAHDRCNEWSQHIDNILLETGADKVHIIAHSQGAIDARILATSISNHCSTPHHGELYGRGYGEYIASITSIAGPHNGTPLADPIYTDDEDCELMLDAVNLIAMMNGSTVRKARQALDSLSRRYMQDVFNPAMKVLNTIPCFTVAGNPSDQKDLSFMFDLTWQKLMDTAIEDGGGENDGFVPVSSARFDNCHGLLAGTDQPQWQHLGDVNADHTALIGMQEEHLHQHFNFQPLYVGLAQHSDSCFIDHMHLALQSDGEWQRQALNQSA